MLILRRTDVADALAGRELEIIDLVADAYRLHDEGATALPHSTFLRFPEDRHARDRIIGLPAYRGGAAPVAGMKWIASFPGNVAAGLERASASITLNSLENGRPFRLPRRLRHLRQTHRRERGPRRPRPHRTGPAHHRRPHRLRSDQPGDPALPGSGPAEPA